MHRYDLVVIGSGPAGEKAAAQAGYFGKRVALVERADAGGACVNSGTIPSKILRESALYFSGLKQRELGWALGLTVGSDSREGQAWLSLLAEREGLPVAVRCASAEGLPKPLRHWRPTRGNESADQRARIRSGNPALVDVALAIPQGARAERAEAFAYFAADTAFKSWEQDKGAQRIADNLRAKWTEPT